MARGRKRKSREHKLLAGTLRQDREPPQAGATKPPPKCPKPPPGIQAEAATHWRAWHDLLVENVGLREVHYPLLGILCIQFQEYLDIRKDWEKDHKRAVLAWDLQRERLEDERDRSRSKKKRAEAQANIERHAVFEPSKYVYYSLTTTGSLKQSASQFQRIIADQEKRILATLNALGMTISALGLRSLIDNSPSRFGLLQNPVGS